MTDSDPSAVRRLAADNLRVLLSWAASAGQQPLPEPVRRRVGTILVDDIGAIVVGASEPQVLRAREGLLASAPGVAQATILAAGAARVDRHTAACANGMAITWCELDEGFRNAACHAGAYTIPALLAEAEACGLTVAALLRALAVAYEVTTRFALAYPFVGFNVHPHAAFATIGGAVAASLVRGHDLQTMQDAVTGAASMSFAGPFSTAVEGSLVRNAWSAAGAWLGMRAADWAEAGIGGGIDTPHDVFVGNYRSRAAPAALIEGLGSTWSVVHGYHKVFACCNYAHAAIEATLELRSRLGSRTAADIVAIEVQAGPGGQALTTMEPATVLAAKFSMPHAVAASALLGTGGATAFTHETLHDEAIAALRRRVRLAPYADVGPPPRDRPARVTWRLRDGSEMVALCLSPRGGADDPFDEPTLLAKLAENTRAIFPNAAAVLAPIIGDDRAAQDQSWPDAMAALVRDGASG